MQIRRACEHVMHHLDEEINVVRLSFPNFGPGHFPLNRIRDWDGINGERPQDPAENAMMVDPGFEFSR